MGRLADGPDGWIAVDFDRTLAYRLHDTATMDAGEPVPVMVARVKKWLDLGLNVRIFTARVGENPPDGRWGTAEQQRELLTAWCIKHIGQALPITCSKDGWMIEMWDDAAVAVEENTGLQLSPSRLGTHYNESQSGGHYETSTSRAEIGHSGFSQGPTQ